MAPLNVKVINLLRLTDLRNFLLTKGGFDTVYEARNAIVNRDLIDTHVLFGDPALRLPIALTYYLPNMTR